MCVCGNAFGVLVCRPAVENGQLRLGGQVLGSPRGKVYLCLFIEHVHRETMGEIKFWHDYYIIGLLDLHITYENINCLSSKKL
jgi:hypothetical protein